jgi:hypothetical protein
MSFVDDAMRQRWKLCQVTLVYQIPVVYQITAAA